MPKVDINIAIMTMSAPRAPAVPIDNAKPKNTNCKMSVTVIGIPYKFAANTPVTPNVTANPSICMVAPNGSVKPYILSDIPNCLALLIDAGKVALLDDVAAARSNVELITLKNSNGLYSVKSLMI